MNKIKLTKNNYLNDTSIIHNDIILEDFLHAQDVNTVDTDLNNYREPGIYHFAADFTPKNIPIGVNGWLIVIDSDKYLATKQIWLRYGTRNTNDFETYIRTFVAEVWSDWKRYTMVDEVYYTPGETETIAEWYSGGYITHNKTRILFTVPLLKSAKNTTGATIISGRLSVRSVDGKYIVDELTLPSNSVGITFFRHNAVTITVANDAGYDTINNTPVGICLDNLVLEFY